MLKIIVPEFLPVEDAMGRWVITQGSPPGSDVRNSSIRRFISAFGVQFTWVRAASRSCGLCPCARPLGGRCTNRDSWVDQNCRSTFKNLGYRT